MFQKFRDKWELRSKSYYIASLDVYAFHSWKFNAIAKGMSVNIDWGVFSDEKKADATSKLREMMKIAYTLIASYSVVSEQLGLKPQRHISLGQIEAWAILHDDEFNSLFNDYFVSKITKKKAVAE